MVCPPGRVNTRDHPLIVPLPVLVMLMASVSPVFQALTVTVTRHELPPAGGVDAGGFDDGALLGLAVRVGLAVGLTVGLAVGLAVGPPVDVTVSRTACPAGTLVA